MSPGRPYMSIGEVLAALKPEFPEVSVSKIRFLETEGLIAPERTASGYRKFYQPDLERLRAVLKLQRDSFLPLRVIRDRLDAGALAPDAMEDRALPTPRPAPETTSATQQAVEPEEDLLAREPALHLTESDLADATGLELGQIQGLSEFGVLCRHSMNGGAYFDADDLAVGRIARDLLKLGIEPRHMKMLRRFAETEADMFSQLVAPVLRNRRPEAREHALETLTELTRLSRRLRHAYLKQSFRPTVSGER